MKKKDKLDEYFEEARKVTYNSFDAVVDYITSLPQQEMKDPNNSGLEPIPREVLEVRNGPPMSPEPAMGEIKRKLASVRRISEMRPIPKADKIELAVVDGWQCVVQKSEGFKVGDLVIYCEIDSMLPIRPQLEFLRPTSYRQLADGSEGFVLRTQEFRGQVSQGLVLPLKYLDTLSEYEEMKVGFSEQPWGKQLQYGPYDDAEVLEVGADLTEAMGIKKFEPPIPDNLKGKVKGYFPVFIAKTDEERIQNLREDYDELKEHEYYSTEKLDGYSATYYLRQGEFGVCSRRVDYLEDPNNAMWQVARRYNIEEKLRALGRNLAIQGELVGGRYGVNGADVKFFNAFDCDLYRDLPFEEFKTLIADLGLPMVPVVHEHFKLPDNPDDLLHLADGQTAYGTGRRREGLVFKSYDGKRSFKVISNKFLLKS